MDDTPIKNPSNQEALFNLKSQTPARIAVGRTGPRYLTGSWLKFRLDHAAAQDTLYHSVSERLLDNLGLFAVQTKAKNTEEFLTRPDLGRTLSDEAIATLRKRCLPNPQVQVYFSDGLSAKAIEMRAKEILPAIEQGLQAARLRMGTPFFLKFGRVAAQDIVGQILGADVVCTLIGERPGLGSTESMGAYLIYKPSSDTKDSDRSMISNIHPNGTPAAEAGLCIVSLIQNILAAKASGLKLIEPSRYFRKEPGPGSTA